MTEALLLGVLMIGLTMSFATGNFVYRCLGLKLASDALAIVIVGFAASTGKGDLRLMSLVILSFSTGLLFLMVALGLRKFRKPGADWVKK